MSYRNFYRYIKKRGNSFVIEKSNVSYGSYTDLAVALYERDRLMKVDWDMDLWVNLAETMNAYIHIDLPPFNHDPSYIAEEKECWVVRGKGKEQRHYGRYPTLEEAKRVALIYNGNISHKSKGYSIRKRINGKSTYFGRYKTLEEAERKVKELKENGWKR